MARALLAPTATRPVGFRDRARRLRDLARNWSREVVVDAAALKEDFAQIAMHGDEVAPLFYSDLFLRRQGPAGRRAVPPDVPRIPQ